MDYWAELENNHHYIIVDNEHDRTFYCPAEEAARSLSRILNDKNKTIFRLEKENKELQKGKLINNPTFEIVRDLDDRRCHVAFVTNEQLAMEFCETYKDCSYHQIPITKYRTELESLRGVIPTCSNCLKFQQGGGFIDMVAKVENKDGYCNWLEDFVNHDEYCSSYEGEEE